MFSSNNFLYNYNSSDTGLVFVNVQGRRVQGINVCKYNNLGIESNIIWILLEGNEKIVLDFINEIDANLALTRLKNALDELQPNCELGITPVVPSGTLSIIQKTVAQYKDLIANSQCTNFGSADLVQWYDLTDTEGLFGEGGGTIFRVLALNPNDSLPQGFNFSTKKWCTLNMTNNQLETTYYNAYHKIELNESKIEGDGSYIYTCNNSNINAIGNTSYIIAENTIATLDSVTYSFLRNCQNLKLSYSEYCYFDGIGGDLTGQIFSHVTIDTNNTIGKQGHEFLNNGEVVLVAYQNSINQIINRLDFAGPITIKNIISNTNAEFNFIIPNDFVGEIQIIDSASSILLTIGPQYAGLILTFKFNKLSGNFYFAKPYGQSSRSGYEVITIGANGQTFFPNVLGFAALNPPISRMFLNGQKQHYGIDYIITNKDIEWIDSTYSLETTDILEIYYE